MGGPSRQVFFDKVFVCVRGDHVILSKTNLLKILTFLLRYRGFFVFHDAGFTMTFRGCFLVFLSSFFFFFPFLGD